MIYCLCLRFDLHQFRALVPTIKFKIVRLESYTILRDTDDVLWTRLVAEEFPPNQDMPTVSGRLGAKLERLFGVRDAVLHISGPTRLMAVWGSEILPPTGR